MTRKRSRGFTLIELLVVILIIGVLAAVALPQYRIAVAKSRYAKLQHLSKSIAEAQEIYYLANGKYSRSFEDLDVSMPSDKLSHSSNNDYQYNWGFCRIFSNLIYCVDNPTQLYYQLMYNHVSENASKRICGVYGAYKEDTVENRICQQETGKVEPDFSDTWYALWIYP